jgi:hypothetical protein
MILPGPRLIRAVPPARSSHCTSSLPRRPVPLTKQGRSSYAWNPLSIIKARRKKATTRCRPGSKSEQNAFGVSVPLSVIRMWSSLIRSLASAPDAATQVKTRSASSRKLCTNSLLGHGELWRACQVNLFASVFPIGRRTFRTRLVFEG